MPGLQKARQREPAGFDCLINSTQSIDWRRDQDDLPDLIEAHPPACRALPEGKESMTKRSDQYRLNAKNCMQMAEAAHSEPAYNRYRRMEAAWLALAEEQDWLDGERSPVDPAPAEQRVSRKRRPSSASKLSKINLRRQIAELGLKVKR